MIVFILEQKKVVLVVKCKKAATEPRESPGAFETYTPYFNKKHFFSELY